MLVEAGARRAPQPGVEEVRPLAGTGEENIVDSLKISEEVIAAIAGLAAHQVEGIAGMSGTLVEDIGAIIGRKSFSKGVRVSRADGEVALDLYLNVKYGARIPEVAFKVQENVKKSVEGMTDLKVTEVNIHVQGVVFPGEEREASGDKGDG